MAVILIAIAAFLGACLSASIGYLDARQQGREAFSRAKFARSVLAGVVAALVLGLSFQGQTVGIRDLLGAVVGGAGFDAVSNRAIGAWPR